MIGYRQDDRRPGTLPAGLVCVWFAAARYNHQGDSEQQDAGRPRDHANLLRLTRRG
jgi:hypothetical protein